MRQIADRFKILMLDDVSYLGASMIASGACFWRNGSGGIGIAGDGRCLDLNARQAGQIRSVLPVAVLPMRQAARLDPSDVPAHVRDVLRLSDPVGARSQEAICPPRRHHGRERVAA